MFQETGWHLHIVFFTSFKKDLWLSHLFSQFWSMLNIADRFHSIPIYLLSSMASHKKRGCGHHGGQHMNHDAGRNPHYWSFITRGRRRRKHAGRSFLTTHPRPTAISSLSAIAWMDIRGSWWHYSGAKWKKGACFGKQIVGCPSGAQLLFLSPLQRSPRITLPVHVRQELCFLGLFWLGSVPIGIPLGTLCEWIVPLVAAKTRPLLWWVREAWKMHWTLHSAPKPHPWPLRWELWFGCNST